MLVLVDIKSLALDAAVTYLKAATPPNAVSFGRLVLLTSLADLAVMAQHHYSL